MSLNCNLDLMCGSDDGLGGPIFYLPFTGGSIDGFYNNYGKATGNFKRASVANQLNDIGATPVAVDVPKLNHGIDLEGAITNKVTCAKNNPTSISGIIKSGDEASILSVVNDSIELGAAGLSAYGPNVYKLDNSIGTTIAYATANGSTENINAHSVSCFMRGSGLGDVYLNAVTGTPVQMTSRYTRIVRNNLIPGASNRFLRIQANPGSVIYFTLLQLEENILVSSPISGSTSGTVLRATEGSNLSDNGLTYTLDSNMIKALRGSKVGL